MFTSTFAKETVISHENIKEILDDMGVKYTPKRRSNAISAPSIFKDGNAYENKFMNGMRKGCPRGGTGRRMFLEGRTVQEVLDFLNDTKKKEISSNNVIKRPGLEVTAEITILPEGPSIKLEGVRPISMEAMYSLNPERAELLNRILRGPKKRKHKVRKGPERIGDNCKPTYDITTGKLSEIVTHYHKSNQKGYNKEMIAITKACEYEKPCVAEGEPYDGHRFQWAAEVPMETLLAILADMKAAACPTYADWQRKLERREAKKLVNDLAYAVNKVNGDSAENAFTLEMVKALERLTAVMEKLEARIQ